MNYRTVLQDQNRVLFALMLHDIKSRFFGNGLGFLVTMLWPLIHMGVLIIIFSTSGRTAPVGNSMLLYIATGVFPFITFSYISRFMSLAVVQNRAFLAYPIIKMIDLLTARAILEIINSFIVSSVMLVIFWAIGVDFIPGDVSGAAEALLASAALGVGFGYFFGVLSALMPLMVTGYALITILVWATCGLLLNVDNLPQPYRYLISFNPILHGVEWMRSSYFHGYGSGVLDKTYMIEVSIGMLAAGLIIERLTRSFVR